MVLKKKFDQAGREIIFSDSHLALKFFKVVTNIKKNWSPFSKTNKTFLNAVGLQIDPPKLS